MALAFLTMSIGLFVILCILVIIMIILSINSYDDYDDHDDDYDYIYEYFYYYPYSRMLDDYDEENKNAFLRSRRRLSSLDDE